MKSHQEPRLLDLFCDNLPHIQQIFYEYLTADTAALIALLPEGYSQLLNYLNDEDKVNQLIGVGLQDELTEIKNKINQEIDRKIAEQSAEVQKSWNPFKWSIPPRLMALGGFGVSMWKGSYRWLRTGVENFISYAALDRLHTDIKNQLETICKTVFPSNFYGVFHCVYDADWVEHCPVVERDYFMTEGCAVIGKSRYYDPFNEGFYDLTRSLKNCSSSLWTSYEANCDGLYDAGSFWKNFSLVFGGVVFTLTIGGITYCCYKRSQTLDLIPRKKILKTNFASIKESIVDPFDEKHLNLDHAILKYITRDQENISIDEVLNRLVLVISKANFELPETKKKNEVPCLFFRSNNKKQIEIDVQDEEVIEDDSNDISLQVVRPLLK